MDSGPLGLSLEASYGVGGSILREAWSDCDADGGGTAYRHSICVRRLRQRRLGRDISFCSRDTASDEGRYDRLSSSGLVRVVKTDIQGIGARNDDAMPATEITPSFMEPPTPLRLGLSTLSSRTAAVGRTVAGGISAQGRRKQLARVTSEGMLAVEEGDILVRVDDVQVRVRSDGTLVKGGCVCGCSLAAMKVGQ